MGYVPYTHRRDDYEDAAAAVPSAALLVAVSLDEDIQADQEKADMGGKVTQKVEEEEDDEEDEFTLEALVGVPADPPQSSLLLLDSSNSSSSHSYKWAEDSVDSFRYYQEVDEFYGDHDTSSTANDIKQAATTCSERSKVVRFSSVHVRDYAMTVGDHPCCKGLCPLSLSWEYSQRAPANIERYEDSRRIRRRRIDATPFNLDANQRRRRLVSVLGSWDALCSLEMEASRASLQDHLDQIFEFENDGDDNDLLEEENKEDDIGDCCTFDYEDDTSESESEPSEPSNSDSSLLSISEFPGLDAEALACCVEEDETLVDMISNILAARRRCGNKREQAITNAPRTTAFASTQQAGTSCLLSSSQQRTHSSTRCS